MLKKLIILSIFLALLIPPFSLAQEKPDWQLKALELQVQIDQLKLLLEQSQTNERVLRSVIQELYQNKFALGTVTAREQLEDYRQSLIEKKKSSE